MLFNSIPYAIFLSIIFILYWFVFQRNLKLQNAFIVVVSYIFYGWWDWRFLILITATSLFSWFSGVLMRHYFANETKPTKYNKAKIVLVSNLVLNLVILVVFKYFNFFVENIIAAFNSVEIGRAHV